MKIAKVSTRNQGQWNEKLTGLESNITYPLGDDRFHIDHGRDYFAFFKRMGEVICYLAHDDGKILGSGIGILRRLPDGLKAWYLCDLKVIPEARGHKLTYKIFRKAFLPNYFRCTRGYAVTMDPPEGENPIIRLSRRLPFTPLETSSRLAFFSLDYESMLSVSDHLESHRGPIGYLSHQGRKDIVLESTGRPMPLWHVQWGAMGESERIHPVEGGIHMFTVPITDPLFEELLSRGFSPTAHAHVLSHRMKHTNWAFILSSDI